MNILLTGASGFIGRNLREHLCKKHGVLAPTHRELDLLETEPVEEFFKKHSIDVVIHGAVRPGHRNAADPSLQLSHNTRMFFNLIRQRARFGKMILLSSGLVYGLRYYQPKMPEDYFDTHVPEDEGGFSKYLLAQYVQKTTDIVELRVFGIFGPHEDYAIRFISNAICKTLFDLPITLKRNRRFDYIYIKDLFPIIDFFINQKQKFPAYNVTPDQSVELYTLAEKVRAISGKDLPIIVAEPGIGIEYSGDNLRLKSEIPHLSFMPVDTAIRELFEWYRQRLGVIDRELLRVDK